MPNILTAKKALDPIKPAGQTDRYCVTISMIILSASKSDLYDSL